MIECIVRHGVSPAYHEIADHLDISRQRVSELVNQLIARGVLERIVASKRGLRVRDVSQSRIMLDQVLQRMGWTVAIPLGELQTTPLPNGQLPMMPAFEHLPDVD